MRGSLSYRRGNCNVSWGEKLKVGSRYALRKPRRATRPPRLIWMGYEGVGRALGERKGSLIIGLLCGVVFNWSKFCSAIAFYRSRSYNYCTAVEITCVTQISNRSLNYKGCYAECFRISIVRWLACMKEFYKICKLTN